MSSRHRNLPTTATNLLPNTIPTTANNYNAHHQPAATSEYAQKVQLLDAMFNITSSLPSRPYNVSHNAAALIERTTMLDAHAVRADDASSSTLPFGFMIVAKFFYISIISFAVVGNLCVLLVYLCTRRKRTYFRYVLVNLAIADLLLACIIPFTMVQVLGNGRWPFSGIMCKAVLYMQLLSVCASVFTLVMVTSSWRWLMNNGNKSNSRGGGSSGNNNKLRAANQFSYKPFVVLWLTLGVLSCVQLKIAHIEHYRTPSGGTVTKCLESGSASPLSNMLYTLFTFFLTYAGPLIHLVINFALIRRKFDKLRHGQVISAEAARALTSPVSLLLMGGVHNNPSFSRNANSDGSSNNTNNNNSGVVGSPNGSAISANSSKRGSDELIRQQQQQGPNNNGTSVVGNQGSASLSPSLNHQPQLLARTAECGSSTVTHSVVVSIIGDAGGDDLYKLKVRRKVLRIFKIIVVLFALCWAPLQVFFLVFTFVLPFTVSLSTLMAPNVLRTLQIIYIICHLLAMSSACVNPVVLSLTHRNFRNDLHRLVRPVWQYLQLRRVAAYVLHFFWLICCCCFVCSCCCRGNAADYDDDEAYYDEAEQGDDDQVEEAEEAEEGEREHKRGRHTTSADHNAANNRKTTRSSSRTASSESNKLRRNNKIPHHHINRDDENVIVHLDNNNHNNNNNNDVLGDKSYYFYRQFPSPPTATAAKKGVVDDQLSCREKQHDKDDSSNEQHKSSCRSSSVPLPPMRGRVKPVVKQQQQQQQKKKKNQTSQKSPGTLSTRSELLRATNNNKRIINRKSNSGCNLEFAMLASSTCQNNNKKKSKRSKSVSSNSSDSSSDSHYAQAHETTYTEQELREGVIILKPSSLKKHYRTISSSSSSQLNYCQQQKLQRPKIPLVILSSVSSPTHAGRGDSNYMAEDIYR